MAAEPQNQDNEDLTMEEILQSIRKIISDDDEPEVPTSETSDEDEKTDMADAAEEVIEAEGSDVLELSEEFEEVVEEPAEAVDVLKEIDDAMDDGEPEEAPVAAEAPVEEAPAEVPVEEAPVAPVADTEPTEESQLLSTGAATASAASLKKMLDTHKTTVPGFRSGTTLEDLVLESMKPMLKEWLDANLPTMVERIVEREIRKLVD